MIKSVYIKNYKSINKLKVELGKFNVLVGENGGGKTNILEAITLATQAAIHNYNVLRFKAFKEIAQNVTQDVEINLIWESGDSIAVRLQKNQIMVCKCTCRHNNTRKWDINEDFLIYDANAARWSIRNGLTIHGYREQEFEASGLTRKTFAIENYCGCINPRLSRKLTQELIGFTEKYNNQIVVTTHQPGVLDGLNLKDTRQRLLTVSRNLLGHTMCRQIFAPKPLKGQDPVALSEAFLRGYVGGLPKDF